MLDARYWILDDEHLSSLSSDRGRVFSVNRTFRGEMTVIYVTEAVEHHRRNPPLRMDSCLRRDDMGVM